MNYGDSEKIFEHTVRLLLTASSTAGRLHASMLFLPSTSKSTKRKSASLFAPPTRAEQNAAVDERSTNCTLTFLERKTTVTVLICWSDSRYGRMGEQTWVRGIARTKAVCALSGGPILRGDSIYHPRSTSQNKCVNALEMILSSVLHEHENKASQKAKGEAVVTGQSVRKNDTVRI